MGRSATAEKKLLVVYMWILMSVIICCSQLITIKTVLYCTVQGVNLRLLCSVRHTIYTLCVLIWSGTGSLVLIRNETGSLVLIGSKTESLVLIGNETGSLVLIGSKTESLMLIGSQTGSLVFLNCSLYL